MCRDAGAPYIALLFRPTEADGAVGAAGLAYTAGRGCDGRVFRRGEELGGVVGEGRGEAYTCACARGIDDCGWAAFDGLGTIEGRGPLCACERGIPSELEGGSAGEGRRREDTCCICGRDIECAGEGACVLKEGGRGDGLCVWGRSIGVGRASPAMGGDARAALSALRRSLSLR